MYIFDLNESPPLTTCSGNAILMYFKYICTFKTEVLKNQFYNAVHPFSPSWLYLQNKSLNASLPCVIDLFRWRCDSVHAGSFKRADSACCCSLDLYYWHIKSYCLYHSKKGGLGEQWGCFLWLMLWSFTIKPLSCKYRQQLNIFVSN